MGSPHVTDGQDVDQCLLALCFYHQEMHPPMLCLSRLGDMKSMDLREQKIQVQFLALPLTSLMQQSDT